MGIRTVELIVIPPLLLFLAFCWWNVEEWVLAAEGKSKVQIECERSSQKGE